MTKIPSEFAADRTTPTKFVNLMEDYSDISLEHLQRESMKIFGTAVDAADPLPTGPFPLRDINPGTDDQDKKTFYKRVHRHTLCEFLKNTFNDQGRQDLLKKMAPYAFIDTTDGTESYQSNPNKLKCVERKALFCAPSGRDTGRTTQPFTSDKYRLLRNGKYRYM